MVKKKESDLEFAKEANNALQRMMEIMLVYATVLKEDETIKKSNAELINQLEALAQKITALQVKAKQNKPIAREELEKATRAFINVNELMKAVKFQDPKGQMLKRVGQAVMVGAKPIDKMPAQERLDSIQQGLKDMGEELRKNMNAVVKFAQPKQRTLWQKLVDAGKSFAQSCSRLFSKLINRRKEETGIVLMGGEKGSPQARLQQQMAAGDSRLAIQKDVAMLGGEVKEKLAQKAERPNPPPPPRRAVIHPSKQAAQLAKRTPPSPPPRSNKPRKI